MAPLDVRVAAADRATTKQTGSSDQCNNLWATTSRTASDCSAVRAPRVANYFARHRFIENPEWLLIFISCPQCRIWTAVESQAISAIHCEFEATEDFGGRGDLEKMSGEITRI
jgi:hypothetical protein